MNKKAIKKITSLFCAAIIMTAFTSGVNAYKTIDNNITYDSNQNKTVLSCHDDKYICVTVNGEEISNSSLAQIINGRTMVPVRSIAVALGATVQWYEETKEISITKNNEIIMLKIGSPEIKINNEIIPMDVSPIIINSYTLVPVRFVSEALNANIGWSDVCGRYVTISTFTITPEEAVELVKTYYMGYDYFDIALEDIRYLEGSYYHVMIYWRDPHDHSQDYGDEGISLIGVNCETGEMIGLAG